MSLEKTPLLQATVLSMALALSAMLGVGCSGDERADASDTTADGVLPPGAECADGDVAECGVTIAQHGSVLQCLKGTKVCEDGRWADCVGTEVEKRLDPRPLRSARGTAKGLVERTPMSDEQAAALLEASPSPTVALPNRLAILGYPQLAVGDVSDSTPAEAPSADDYGSGMATCPPKWRAVYYDVGVRVVHNGYVWQSRWGGAGAGEVPPATPASAGNWQYVASACTVPECPDAHVVGATYKRGEQVQAGGTIYVRTSPTWDGVQTPPGSRWTNTGDTSCAAPVVCGDGILAAGEQCDPGAPLNHLACNPATCQWAPVCGDSIITTPEQCDPPASGSCTATCENVVQCYPAHYASTTYAVTGSLVSRAGRNYRSNWWTSATPPDASWQDLGACNTDPSCPTAWPGASSGTVSYNNRIYRCPGGGCSTGTVPTNAASGWVDTGDLCAICGNGTIETGEDCEFTLPATPSDVAGCDADCTAPACNDGVWNAAAGEVCDPSESPWSATTCSAATCTMLAYCGDGTVDAGEECDPGNSSPGVVITTDLACDGTCKERCGNGVFDSGAPFNEECDPDAAPWNGAGTCDPASCTLFCGNGVVDPGEDCEESLDGAVACKTDCTWRCGDGVVETGAPYLEQCEDGIAPWNGAGTCDASTCQLYCGNGALDAGEECDPGLNPACSATCLLVCGNGAIDPGEWCDPGSSGGVPVANDPLCDDTCKPRCGNGVTEPAYGEDCDHGGAPDATCDVLCGAISAGTGGAGGAGTGGSIWGTGGVQDIDYVLGGAGGGGAGGMGGTSEDLISTACVDNPCNPECNTFVAIPPGGLSTGTGTVTTDGAPRWKTFDPATRTALTGLVVSDEPCQTGLDCQINQRCDDVATDASCDHSKCVPGAGLDECEGADECVARVCDALPGCCTDDGNPSTDEWNSACIDLIPSVCDAECGAPGTCPSEATDHGVCDVGGALDGGCDWCVAAVCAAHPSCCADDGNPATDEWDATCVAAVYTECGYTAPTGGSGSGGAGSGGSGAGGSGGGSGLPACVEPYSAGDSTITNCGKRSHDASGTWKTYQCGATTGGWCASPLASFYEPGAGSAWTSAWLSTTTDCDASQEPVPPFCSYAMYTKSNFATPGSSQWEIYGTLGSAGALSLDGIKYIEEIRANGSITVNTSGHDLDVERVYAGGALAVSVASRWEIHEEYWARGPIAGTFVGDPADLHQNLNVDPAYACWWPVEPALGNEPDIPTYDDLFGDLTATEISDAALVGSPMSCVTSPDYNVWSGNTLTLAPGSYGDVLVSSNSSTKLVLSAPGEYRFNSLYIDSQAQIYVPTSGQVVISTCGNLTLRNNVEMLEGTPGSSTTLSTTDGSDANRITWYVEGNVDYESSWSKPIWGAIVVPNGSTRLRNGCTIDGRVVSNSFTDVATGVKIYNMESGGSLCGEGFSAPPPACPHTLDTDAPPPGTGECVAWGGPPTSGTESAGICDSEFDLAVGASVGAGVPVCNHGNASVTGQIPLTFFEPDATTWATDTPVGAGVHECVSPSVTLAPGACTNVVCTDEIPQEDVTVMVNAPGSSTFLAGECSDLDNWTMLTNDCFVSGGCGGTAPAPPGAPYADLYQATCPYYAHAQWDFLGWEASTPGGSEITLLVRTGDDPVAMDSSGVDVSTILGEFEAVTINTANGNEDCPFTTAAGCYLDLYLAFGEVDARRDYLQVVIQPVAGSDPPVLARWDALYTCVIDQ